VPQRGTLYCGMLVPAVRMNLSPPSSERTVYPEAKHKSSMHLRNVSTCPPNQTSHNHRPSIAYQEMFEKKLAKRRAEEEKEARKRKRI
jgi:hypothetical protein